MQESLDQYYLKKDEPQKSCLLALRAILLNHHESMSETRKYGMPCFCYKKKALCYLWTNKKTDEPYILFVDGQLINNSSLEAGSRSRMKILPIQPNNDIPLKTIKELLDLAIALKQTS